VRPGDVIMEILPTDSTLIVEAKYKPADIAYIKKGLLASIKLDSYDYSIYGRLRGEVVYISPDALTERTSSGDSIFYRVHVSMDESALNLRNSEQRGKIMEIQPGMTATVEIQTGSHSVLSYLIKPVTKTLSESLSER
ncbi:MAG: HlyD family efflux transporter periplasmic adaptor subunit, partial [Betaproteobacteria bacterium]